MYAPTINRHGEIECGQNSDHPKWVWYCLAMNGDKPKILLFRTFKNRVPWAF